MATVTEPLKTPDDYPATLTIDYPDRTLNRLSSFFRILVAVPICIVIGLMGNGAFNFGSHSKGYMMTGLLFLPLVLMILFRTKYPRWWFDWNLAFSRFSYRVCAFIFLLRDEYPSTDEEQAVHLGLVYPDVKNQLSRGMPLVKWFLALPHYIILAFLTAAAVIVMVIAWLAILFTGKYPRSLFDFMVGVMRWDLRVMAYAFLLITDKYPKFSLNP